MENPIIKILRFLLFFPLCFIIMAIVNWGFIHLLMWYMGFSVFWFIVVLFFLGGIIWGLFKMFASLLVMLATYFSPIKWLGTLTITILALANGGHLGYKLWTIKDIYSGWEIFVAVIATLFVLELTFVLIYGSLSVSEERYRY